MIARVNLGGTARWLETLSAEQIAAGQQVIVAAGGVQRDEVEDPAAGSMPLLRIGRLGRAISPLDDLDAWRELRDLIGDWRPDVVNTHTAKAGVIGRTAALSFGKRRPALAHTVHGHLLQGYFSKAAVRGIALSERLMASASDVVLVVGKRVRDDLVAAKIISPDKAVAVRPGVRDFPRISRSEARSQLGILDWIEAASASGAAPPIAGWLGRVTQVKRPDRLVSAAQGTSGVAYILGGDGALRAEVIDRAPRNVRALGWADPATFWSACDLAVLTSDNEGVPTSLIEASLAGLPTVTTNAGSASEVVLDGVTGLVVPLSAEGVAEGVRRLTADPDMLAAMGTAARKRALVEFSPRRMLVDHTAAYEAAIARRG